MLSKLTATMFRSFKLKLSLSVTATFSKLKRSAGYRFFSCNGMLQPISSQELLPQSWSLFSGLLQQSMLGFSSVSSVQQLIISLWCCGIFIFVTPCTLSIR